MRTRHKLQSLKACPVQGSHYSSSFLYPAAIQSDGGQHSSGAQLSPTDSENASTQLHQPVQLKIQYVDYSASEQFIA